MPEFDSMYGAESKAAFDAGQAPKGNTSHGNPFSGQGGNNQKKTTSTKDHTGKVISGIGFATNLNPIKALGTAYTWGKSLFQHKAGEPTLTEKTAAMEDAYVKPRASIDRSHQGGDGMANVNVTLNTQSLITSPTADKSFGHQWDFKAYGDTQNVAANPYNYNQAPFAKKGKMIRKYATGQEVKNFSKGKRFGPPPLKGPDPQGIQVLLENSDYFKKLIG